MAKKSLCQISHWARETPTEPGHCLSVAETLELGEFTLSGQACKVSLVEVPRARGEQWFINYSFECLRFLCLENSLRLQMWTWWWPCTQEPTGCKPFFIQWAFIVLPRVRLCAGFHDPIVNKIDIVFALVKLHSKWLWIDFRESMNFLKLDMKFQCLYLWWNFQRGPGLLKKG